MAYCARQLASGVTYPAPALRGPSSAMADDPVGGRSPSPALRWDQLDGGCVRPRRNLHSAALLTLSAHLPVASSVYVFSAVPVCGDRAAVCAVHGSALHAMHPLYLAQAAAPAVRTGGWITREHQPAFRDFGRDVLVAVCLRALSPSAPVARPGSGASCCGWGWSFRVVPALRRRGSGPSAGCHRVLQAETNGGQAKRPPTEHPADEADTGRETAILRSAARCAAQSRLFERDYRPVSGNRGLCG